MMMKKNDNGRVAKRVASIQAGVLAFVFAIVCGLVFFIITAWLVIKGGNRVGPHLQLLGQYFIGYTVTWKGCFIGFIYGGIIGGLTGWIIGIIYNKIIGFRIR